MPTVWTIPVSNPDAETGDSSNWTFRVGSLGVSTTAFLGPAPPQGTWAFHGLNNLTTDAYQVFSLDMSSGLITSVDSGLIELVWRCQQGGPATQVDVGGLYVSMMNSAGVILGYHTTDYMTPNSAFVERILRTVIPASVRVVQAGVVCQRSAGSANNVYWDVFSLVAQIPFDNVKQRLNLTVQNPDATLGTSFWSVVTGAFKTENRNYFNPTTPSFLASDSFVNNSPAVYQDIDLFAVTDAQAIASGAVNAFMSYRWNVDSDSGRLAWKFYDATLATLLGSGNEIPCSPYKTVGAASFGLTFQTLVPSGTRYARIEMQGINRSGNSTNFYWDDVSAWLLVDSSAVPVSGAGPTKRAFPAESAVRIFPITLNRTEPVV